MGEYVSAAPLEVKGKLEQVRRVTRAAASTAAESTRYRIPFYDYKGRLVWFGL